MTDLGNPGGIGLRLITAIIVLAVLVVSATAGVGASHGSGDFHSAVTHVEMHEASLLNHDQRVRLRQRYDLDLAVARVVRKEAMLR